MYSAFGVDHGLEISKAKWTTAVHGDKILRSKTSDANIFRGKKYVLKGKNTKTGEKTKKVAREGNVFFKPKDVAYKNGKKYGSPSGNYGGLTNTGKATFIGGPAAAAGIGGVALEEKVRRSEKNSSY
jgi:hypothetical protein